MNTGDTLKNRFELKSVLSVSATGTVYEAIDLRQQASEVEDPRLVVKILNQGISDNEPVASELCRVSVKNRTLQHPNIMNFYEFDLDDDRAFLTMPLIQGNPLDIYLEQNDITSVEARRIIRDVTAGLHYIHEHNVVHGDLGPATIYLTADGTAKIFDMGVREVFREFAGPNESRYASPGVRAGGTPSAADDLYALGILSYEILTGIHPLDEAGVA